MFGEEPLGKRSFDPTRERRRGMDQVTGANEQIKSRLSFLNDNISKGRARHGQKRGKKRERKRENSLTSIHK